MKLLQIMTVLFGLAVNLSAIENTPENRAREADEFLEVYPVQNVLATAIEKAGEATTQQKREMLKVMMAHLDIEGLKKAFRETWINSFTADDLHALRQFYSTPAGKGVWDKFSTGGYMYMSAHDLAALKAFYSTPAGKSVWEKKIPSFNWK